jgi:lysosomal alpha-mannosidase
VGISQYAYFNYLFVFLGHRGNNSEFEFRASGAYIFRPIEQDPIPMGDPETVTVQDGDHFIEFQMEYGFQSPISQVVRLPKNGKVIHDLEVEWMVGPIPIDDGNGKEFINKITMIGGWNNAGEFYTDANGRQNVRRQRNTRPDYDLGNKIFLMRLRVIISNVPTLINKFIEPTQNMA